MDGRYVSYSEGVLKILKVSIKGMKTVEKFHIGSRDYCMDHCRLINNDSINGRICDITSGELVGPAQVLFIILVQEGCRCDDNNVIDSHGIENYPVRGILKE